MQLTILGNGAGGPYQGRAYTAQVLQAEGHVFLIDCGEGTQMQFYRHRIRYDACRQIFISHLHGDHVFGLAGLITSFSLKKRIAPLEIFSPPGLGELIATTFRVCGAVPQFELSFHEVDTAVSQVVFENKLLTVSTIPLNHRIACTGWLFREKPRPLNLRPEKIEQYDIHFRFMPGIKEGNDFTLPDGRVIPNAELTLPPKPPRSYAFCSDTAFYPPIAELVRGVDLLYHEATFTDEHQEEAKIAYHSTAAQAAEIAHMAGVKKLMLGHFSARYKDLAWHLAQARAVFAETELAEEGKKVEV